MIGNDIIDIAYTKKTTDWQRRGFLKKVFSDAEQDIISEAEDAFAAVWRLWSMKEAAYKSYLQKGGLPFNSPARIAIKLTDTTFGSAEIGEFYQELRTDQADDYIASYTQPPAELKQVNQVFNLSKNDPATQSAETRKMLIQRLAQDYHLEEKELSISKNLPGPPELYLGKQKLKIAFSMSHHGVFGVFSFLD